MNQKTDAPSTNTVDLTDPPEKIWECQIGGRTGHGLPGGADGPMRQAVEEMFLRLTGCEAEFTFSGWGSKLSEGRRAVVENRRPDRDKEIAEARELLRIVDYKTEQPDEPAGIWVLTFEVNAYDQECEYFERAWDHKPSAAELLAAKVKAGDVDHVLAGGGRRGVESQWQHLRKQSTAETKEENNGL